MREKKNEIGGGRRKKKTRHFGQSGGVGPVQGGPAEGVRGKGSGGEGSGARLF